MTRALDATDRRILSELQQDSSMTNAQLAERVNLTTTPCLRRVRRMEQEGVIKGYQARLDPRALGIGVSAFVFLKLTRQTAEQAKQFENQVKNIPQITEYCVVSGDHDYVLRVVARDLERYERFMKEELVKIRGITGVSSTMVLSQNLDSSKLPVNL